MNKTFYLICLSFILIVPGSSAEQLSYTSSFPAPSGNYQSVRLVPQAALPSTNCAIGTLYANASDNSNVYYCQQDSPSPKFVPISGPWTLNGNYLYLSDTTTPENKKVGIGTIAPSFKLTLDVDGGILADHTSGAALALPVSGAGTRLIWYPAKRAFRVGNVLDNRWDDSKIGYDSIAMGQGPRAEGPHDIIWGGRNNYTPPGGSGYNMLAGGCHNYALTGAAYTQILGGEDNIAGGSYALLSGFTNSAGANTIIGGGSGNTALNGTSQATYSIINGGRNNILVNASGIPNILSSTISGGDANQTLGDYSVISGGQQNSQSTTCNYCTISGGYANIAQNSTHITISGGASNDATGNYSTISGGNNNTTSDLEATIGGGNGNQAVREAFVGGGNNNNAGDQWTTIIGGSGNAATGYESIAAGGENNSTAAEASFVAGRNMVLGAAADYSFLWGYSNSAIAALTSPNTFYVYSGRMGIRDTTPGAVLEINKNGSTDDYLYLTSNNNAATTPGNILKIKANGDIGVKQTNPLWALHFGNGAYVNDSGKFINASSREYKNNIRELDVNKALKAFSQLKAVRFNYKNEPHEEYLGFIAEDVPSLVADENREALSSLEITAVITKAIQEQEKILNEQKETINALMNEVDILKDKIQKRKP